jgi:hypothetical protein
MDKLERIILGDTRWNISYSMLDPPTPSHDFRLYILQRYSPLCAVNDHDSPAFAFDLPYSRHELALPANRYAISKADDESGRDPRSNIDLVRLTVVTSDTPEGDLLVRAISHETGDAIREVAVYIQAQSTLSGVGQCLSVIAHSLKDLSIRWGYSIDLRATDGK